VTAVDALLAVYDQQMRGVEPTPPAGVRYERDGPLLRVVGGHRGYISGPRDIGVTGAELDRLIARQRDYFAGRGEAVGWQTRAHDEPADLTARLRAAGFVPGEEQTVLIGLTAELATAPVLPGGVILRWVTADDDMRRIAAMQCAIWGQDWSWLVRLSSAGSPLPPMTSPWWPRKPAVTWSLRPGWLSSSQELTASPACWAARHCRNGAAAGYTGRWSLPVLSALPHAASSTCRPMPLTTALPFCAVWDSAW
jgi:hypothetical protein